MEENNLWSRRKFSKAVLSLQGLVAAGVLNISIGCKNKTVKNGEVLDSSQVNLLKLLMDEIIPISNNMPSASQMGGVEYISSIFKEYPELIEGFHQVLAKLNEHSNMSVNVKFEKLDKQARIELLKEFEQVHSDLFTVLVNFVYESYYINEKVWKLIGYEPHPTLSGGPEMEPFNERLLDRVKQLPALYKKV